VLLQYRDGVNLISLLMTLQIPDYGQIGLGHVWKIIIW